MFSRFVCVFSRFVYVFAVCAIPVCFSYVGLFWFGFGLEAMRDLGNVLICSVSVCTMQVYVLVLLSRLV